MKQQITKLNNYFIPVFICAFLSCTSKKEHLARQIVSVMVDNTDTCRVLPETESTIALFDFKHNICKAVTFRFQFIGNLYNAPDLEIPLDNRIEEDKAGNLSDDPQFRQKQIIKFMNDVSRVLACIPLGVRSTLPQTLCYAKVCQELTYLKEMDGNKKVVIISSDMIENSEIVHGYAEGLFQAMERDQVEARNSLVEKFTEAGGMPDHLTGFRIYILFKPKNHKDDLRFRVFANAYRVMLEARGAQVYVKSNNILKSYPNEN